MFDSLKHDMIIRFKKRSYSKLFSRIFGELDKSHLDRIMYKSTVIDELNGMPVGGKITLLIAGETSPIFVYVVLREHEGFDHLNVDEYYGNFVGEYEHHTFEVTDGNKSLLVSNVANVINKFLMSNKDLIQ